MITRPINKLQLLKFVLATIVFYRVEYPGVGAWRDRSNNANTLKQVIIDPLLEIDMHCLSHHSDRGKTYPFAILSVFVIIFVRRSKVQPKWRSLGMLCDCRCGRRAGELGRRPQRRRIVYLMV